MEELSSELQTRPGAADNDVRYSLPWEPIKMWFASLQQSDVEKMSISNSDEPSATGSTFNYGKMYTFAYTLL